MRVIVPALITDSESATLLDRTIRAIPANVGAEVFLVTQGTRPVLPKYEHLGALEWCHSNIPLKKWGAVREILSWIPVDSQLVMLLDADDSVAGASLQAIWAHCAREEVSFLVGNRDRITLGAADQLSSSSRLYLEVFTNTLLLLVMDEVSDRREWYPDIQSGTYVVRSDLLHAVDFSEVCDYGGELVLYYRLRLAGAIVSRCMIATVARTRSSYSIRTIIDDVLKLRFFSGASPGILKMAKHLAPKLYARYFDGCDINQFGREIDCMFQWARG